MLDEANEYADLNHRWATHMDEWVSDRFPDVVLTTQQLNGCYEINRLVKAKLNAAAGFDLDEEEKAYVHKIGLSIMSGHVTGKDFFASLCVLFFLSVFPNPKVLCTAPTNHQLRDILWSEIAKVMRLSRKTNPDARTTETMLQDMFEWNTDKVFLKKRKGREWFAVARSVNLKGTAEEQAETLAGLNEDYKLYVLDEACHDDRTEVLTSEGWKFFSEVDFNDEVLSMDRATGESDYYSISDIHTSYYDGVMYEYVNRGGSFCVTPNHRMWLKSGKGHWDDREIRNLGKGCQYGVKRDVCFDGSDIKEININGYLFQTDDWLRLLAWYLSEGNILRQSKRVNYLVCGICITQKEQNQGPILDLLQRMGINYKVYGDQIRIHNSQLGREFSLYGKGAQNKRIPRYVFRVSRRQKRIFLNTYCDGDGYVKTGKNVYYTSSKGLADDLQELSVLSGKICSISIRAVKGNVKWIVDHWAVSSVDGYVVSEYKDNTLFALKTQHLKEIPYQGNVYCLTVKPHHLLYTRRDGKCMWSGNSDVPDPVMKPIEGSLAGILNIVVAIFNPTKTKGFAWESQYKDDRWIRLRWNAEESERVSKDHIATMRKKYDVDSNPYRVRVLGLPPKAENDALIPWDWIYNAIERDLGIDDADPLVKGFDCAAGGDQNVICTRRGGKVFDFQCKSSTSKDEMVSWVVRDFRQDEADVLFMDSIAIGWGPLEDIRKELGSFAHGIDARARASSDVFANKRAEMYSNLRDAFEQNSISIPRDDMLIGELASIKIEEDTYNNKGQVQIGSKKMLRKALGRSTDRADALAFTYAEPGIIYRHRVQEEVEIADPAYAFSRQ